MFPDAHLKGETGTLPKKVTIPINLPTEAARNIILLGSAATQNIRKQLFIPFPQVGREKKLFCAPIAQ